MKKNKDNKPLSLKIEKYGYTFFMNNYTDAETAFRQLYKENPNHPIFEDYVKTGILSGFTVTNLGKKPRYRGRYWLLNFYLFWRIKRLIVKVLS